MITFLAMSTRVSGTTMVSANCLIIDWYKYKRMRSDQLVEAQELLTGKAGG